MLPEPPALPGIRVGADLVEVARVERLIADNPGLAARVFTGRERAYCASRPHRSGEHLAARFAAKEAVLKALGTGAAGADWTEVEVVNQAGGRPVVRLHGRAADLAERRHVRQTDISLSHGAGLATAYAVLVCAEPDQREPDRRDQQDTTGRATT
ncbi:holo-ACP synthase [Streptomyces sp. NPDC059900]|uniref:holo-ACP synthase n=1 Tax=Streptomyces sp. NPDC059900 TaxID=3155816 RepID=UPI00341CC473